MKAKQLKLEVRLENPIWSQKYRSHDLSQRSGWSSPGKDVKCKKRANGNSLENLVKEAGRDGRKMKKNNLRRQPKGGQCQRDQERVPIRMGVLQLLMEAER